MLFQILIAALAIMAVSLIGVLFTQKIARGYLEKNLTLLVSFSSGVFLVTALVLAREVFELIPTLWIAAAMIGLGYALAWLVHYLIPESHHHHDANCAKGARKLLIGDAVHNIGDGIILVPAFLVSPALGLAVTVSIVIHEALQEISEFFVLRQAGYSVKKALLVNFAVSSTILIGVFVSYFALSISNLEGFLLAISSGFFLHVVFHDLLPKKSKLPEKNMCLKHFLVACAGAVLMISVNTALGESHVHGDEHTHEHAGEEKVGDHDKEHGHEEEHGHGEEPHKE